MPRPPTPTTCCTSPTRRSAAPSGSPSAVWPCRSTRSSATCWAGERPEQPGHRRVLRGSLGPGTRALSEEPRVPRTHRRRRRRGAGGEQRWRDQVRPRALRRGRGVVQRGVRRLPGSGSRVPGDARAEQPRTARCADGTAGGRGGNCLRMRSSSFRGMQASSFVLETNARLAEHALLAGRPAEALRRTDEALRVLAEAGSGKVVGAMLHRLRGYALMHEGRPRRGEGRA